MMVNGVKHRLSGKRARRRTAAHGQRANVMSWVGQAGPASAAGPTDNLGSNIERAMRETDPQAVRRCVMARRRSMGGKPLALGNRDAERHVPRGSVHKAIEQGFLNLFWEMALEASQCG